jgi:hypothetical protein
VKVTEIRMLVGMVIVLVGVHGAVIMPMKSTHTEHLS